MNVRWFALSVLVTVAACDGDEAAQPDGGIDAEGDSGLCGATGVFFTGELLDFNASVSNPAAVAGAAMTVRGDASRADTTDDMGRFELCLTDDPMTIVDVTPMGISGTSYIGGLAVVHKDVASSGVYSMRSMTRNGAAAFAFDPAKAHVFVHVAGNSRTVTVTAQHERAYSWINNMWDGGNNVGTNVYFANVNPTGGMTKMNVPMAIGVPTEIPIEAGKITFVVVRTQ
jgi:hypothetical protein